MLNAAMKRITKLIRSTTCATESRTARMLIAETLGKAATTARCNGTSSCGSTRVVATYVMGAPSSAPGSKRSEEHTSELQSQSNLVCRLLLEKKKKKTQLKKKRVGAS